MFIINTDNNKNTVCVSEIKQCKQSSDLAS